MGREDPKQNTYLYCIVLYFIVMYCIILYCTVLYCTVYCPVQVQGWMKKTDSDKDGKLSYKEFNKALKIYLDIAPDDTEEAE